MAQLFAHAPGRPPRPLAPTDVPPHTLAWGVRASSTRGAVVFELLTATVASLQLRAALKSYKAFQEVRVEYDAYRIEYEALKGTTSPKLVRRRR